MSRSPGLRWVTSLSADFDTPLGQGLEPGRAAQQCRLAAARGPDKHQEFAIPDLEIDARQGKRSVVEALADGSEAEGRRRTCLPRELDALSAAGEFFNGGQDARHLKPVLGIGKDRHVMRHRVDEACDRLGDEPADAPAGRRRHTQHVLRPEALAHIFLEGAVLCRVDLELSPSRRRSPS